MSKVHTKGRTAKRGGKMTTRSASFKDAPRRKSSRMPRMVRSYIEPVAVPALESADTGAKSLSIESPEPVRREIPAPACVGLREHVCDDPRECIWIIDGMDAAKDRVKPGWWIGSGVARRTDKRKLSERKSPSKSDKQSIGKVKPVTDRTPVIERVKE